MDSRRGRHPSLSLPRTESYLRHTIEHCQSDPFAPDHFLTALACRSLALAYVQQGLQQEAIRHQQAAIDHFIAIQLQHEVVRTQSMSSQVALHRTSTQPS